MIVERISKSKKVMLAFCCLALLLFSCNTNVSKEATPSHFEITMELSDDSDPFIDERLFEVTSDLDVLELDVKFILDGKSGLLEIADNDTKEIIWSNQWEGNVKKDSFTIALELLKKENEYVIQFTGTEIKQAKIIVTSKSKEVKERNRPKK